MLHFTREQLQDIETLETLFPPGMVSYIVDVGGYFASLPFFKFNATRQRVLGIIEDTENGLQKYLPIQDKISMPIVSVARSALKQNEDDLIGYSVAYYTEMVTRMFRRLPRYMTCGIIGYGKLGKGIARYLFNQNIKPLAYDIDPLKTVEAYKDGCIPVDKETILRKSNLLLCATGSFSLNGSDFSALRPGVFVASVTSSDDEFDLSNLSRIFRPTRVNDFVTRMDSPDNYFYLINDGNAVNFIDKNGDRVGNFIRLVQAEILTGLDLLIGGKLKPGIQDVPREKTRRIAQHFLDQYTKSTD